jgi:hypothetical protein
MLLDVDCFDLKRCKNAATFIIGRKKSGKTSLMKEILLELNTTPDTVISDRHWEWATDLIHVHTPDKEIQEYGPEKVICLDFQENDSYDLEHEPCTLLLCATDMKDMNVDIDYIIFTSMPSEDTWVKVCNYMFPFNQQVLRDCLAKIHPFHFFVLDLIHKKVCFLANNVATKLFPTSSVQTIDSSK